MVVFFWISLVMMPPRVSMPSDSGVTSSSSTSLTVALQHAALDGGADGHGFVRVHVLARFLAEEFLDLLLHLGHAGLGRRPGSRRRCRPTSTPASFSAMRQGSMVRSISSSTSDSNLARVIFSVQVLRAGGVGGDVGQVDFGLLAGGQLDLGLFGGFLQALQGQHVASSG